MTIVRPSTQQILSDSLFELTKSTPYRNITISDITKNCGLSTRTFYNYFKDKDELTEWRYFALRKKVFEETILKGLGYPPYALDCVRGFTERANYMKNIEDYMRRHYWVSTFILDAHLKLFIDYFKSKFGAEAIDDRIIFSFENYILTGCNMLFQWHKNGMITPAETLATWHVEDMPPCLKPYLLVTA
ncbi:MAG: TetR/AcrR family transcriptional regulator [Coriobacteriales bacterium]|jgi:AcrR family transcriptional regulator|nr:TetR/AcrR family transcriptional regulator [Coriobacteriales bacterium]